ncbi:MAG: phosphomannomutase/phosphoglucomutase [Pseudomonadota bacterium]
MLDPARLRHAYDLRGRPGIDFDEHDLHALGLAFAARLRAHGGQQVALGHDGRLTSASLARAFSKGLIEGGMTVFYLGLAPSPQVYFAERQLSADAAAVITASHNPADWNGLKLVERGEVVFGASLAELVTAAQHSPPPAPGGSLRPHDLRVTYLEHLLRDRAPECPLRVGLDGMHGAAGPLARTLLEALGMRALTLHCEVDGRFPRHPPDPSRPEHLHDLARLVIDHGLDLGLALDGDGDRLVVMDGRGEAIEPDRLLVLFARDMLEREPGATVLMDVKGSHATQRATEQAGGRVILVPSGHAHMRAAMRQTGARLGGELSGHLFFAENGYDDGLDAAARLLRLLARHPDRPTTLFDALPRAHATPEIQLPRPPDLDLEGLLARLAVDLTRPNERLLRIDGLRLESPEGFILVRASNTQPLLTLRIEGEDEAALLRLKSRLVQAWPETAPPLPF